MPALIDTRLAYLRYTTKMHIADDPTSVILGRTAEVAMPGGGHDYPKIDLPVQLCRFVNQTNSDGIEYSSNDDGQARKFIYITIWEWDADVQINDVWEDGEKKYSIDGLLPANDYEIRAVVTAFAKVPDHG